VPLADAQFGVQRASAFQVCFSDGQTIYRSKLMAKSDPIFAVATANDGSAQSSPQTSVGQWLWSLFLVFIQLNRRRIRVSTTERTIDVTIGK
jgi:hypothetical protein